MPKTEENVRQGNTRKKKNSMAKQVWYRLRKDKQAMFAGVIVILFILIAIFAPVIAPYDPYSLNPQAILNAPSAAHPFGTDELGRDVMSRLIYGSRYSLVLGFSGSIVGMVIGVIFGSIAGYYGGWVENLILRICDVWNSIPGNILTIVLSASLGAGFVQTLVALTIGSIPGKIRMLRAQILREKNEEYLEAAKAYSCSNAKIMFVHLLPNVISPLLVSFTMGIGATIMAATGLSYLGLGIQPPTPEWGAILSSGRIYIRNYPYLIMSPGIVIMVFVWSINILGDGFRDAMDPKLKT